MFVMKPGKTISVYTIVFLIEKLIQYYKLPSYLIAKLNICLVEKEKGMRQL